MATVDEEVDSFRAFLRDEMPAPPHAADKPRQDEIAVTAYRAGIDWAMLTDVVEDSEVSALTALIQVVTYGFRVGLEQRAADSVLGAEEIGG